SLHTTTGSKGSIASRPRLESASPEVPRQLPDILATLRRVATELEGSDLQAPLGGAVRTGTGRTVPFGALTRRPPGHRRDPARHQEGFAGVLPERDEVGRGLTPPHHRIYA